jgi:hypothetical protein
MPFDSKECAWAQTKIKILTRTVVGIRGFSFKYNIEKEHLFAAGSMPIGIQDGNEKPEGNIKLLKFELDMLNDAAQLAGYKSIIHVPHTLILITCSFKKDISDTLRIIEATGVGLMEWDISMEQNAKMTEITMPFICLDMTMRKGA